MYKNIELKYKNESPYNKIKKKTFIIYIIGIIISLLFNTLKLYGLMICALFLTLILIKNKCEKILDTKLYFNFNKRYKKEKSLSELVIDNEKQIFKNHLLMKNMYEEKSILCIIEHYRTLIKPRIVNGNLLAILSIIIPIPLAFATNDGFDFKSFSNAVPYLVFFSLIVIMIYIIYRQFMQIKDFFKCEDGMNERLEEIFSELYIECICEKTHISKVKNGKNTRFIKRKNK